MELPLMQFEVQHLAFTFFSRKNVSVPYRNSPRKLLYFRTFCELTSGLIPRLSDGVLQRHLSGPGKGITVQAFHKELSMNFIIKSTKSGKNPFGAYFQVANVCS